MAMRSDTCTRPHIHVASRDSPQKRSGGDPPSGRRYSGDVSHRVAIRARCHRHGHCPPPERPLAAGRPPGAERDGIGSKRRDTATGRRKAKRSRRSTSGEQYSGAVADAVPAPMVTLFLAALLTSESAVVSALTHKFVAAVEARDV